MTIFFTTHYMEGAERVADEIAVIDHGRIVAEGTAAALRERPAAALWMTHSVHRHSIREAEAKTGIAKLMVSLRSA